MIDARFAPFFQLSDKNGYIDLYLPYDEAVNPSSPFYPANPNGINIIMNDALFYFFVGFSEQAFFGGIQWKYKSYT